MRCSHYVDIVTKTLGLLSIEGDFEDQGCGVHSKR